MSTAVYLLACCVLAYGGFCRLVRTDLTTAFCIRVVFWLLTVAAASSSAAVLIWGYVPGWPAAVLAAAMAGVQTATALLWRHGVPVSYKHPPGEAQP
ncbi:hypothetical protein [Rhodoferax sp.]|uniref:hypothetical protein n=1 Tax=Rhodoferax sp. TaxID=50421 RepID=UPI00374D3199